MGGYKSKNILLKFARIKYTMRVYSNKIINTRKGEITQSKQFYLN